MKITVVVTPAKAGVNISSNAGVPPDWVVVATAKAGVNIRPEGAGFPLSWE
jgi:hypothetical protein